MRLGSRHNAGHLYSGGNLILLLLRGALCLLLEGDRMATHPLFLDDLEWDTDRRQAIESKSNEAERGEASRHHDRKMREQGGSWWRRGKMILEREAGQQPRSGRGTPGLLLWGHFGDVGTHNTVAPDRGNGLESELLGPLRDLYLKPILWDNPSASPFIETWRSLTNSLT